MNKNMIIKYEIIFNNNLSTIRIKYNDETHLIGTFC